MNNKDKTVVTIETLTKARYQALDKFHQGTRLVAEAERELAAVANLAIALTAVKESTDVGN